MKSKVQNRMRRKNRVLNKLKRRMLSLLLKMSTITDFFYIFTIASSKKKEKKIDVNIK